MDLGLAYGRHPGAFWTWTEEEQVDALAYRLIGVAVAQGLEPQEAQDMELTAANLRYSLSRAATLGDLARIVGDMYRKPAEPDITEDVVAEARRRRGLE